MVTLSSSKAVCQVPSSQRCEEILITHKSKLLDGLKLSQELKQSIITL